MIGYSGKDYNPCVNYNRDAFCGSVYHKQLMAQIAANRAPHNGQTSYNAPRNTDAVAVYSFTPAGSDSMECGDSKWYNKKC